MASEKSLDEIGRDILRALQENARISFSELGRRVGLSSPAVAERVHRMETAGLITGYAAIVDREAVGYPITAFVRLNVSHDMTDDAESFVEGAREIVEAHRLTGTNELLLKTVLESVTHLGELITKLSAYGQTTSQIVISTPVSRRTIEPRDV